MSSNTELTNESFEENLFSRKLELFTDEMIQLEVLGICTYIG